MYMGKHIHVHMYTYACTPVCIRAYAYTHAHIHNDSFVCPAGIRDAIEMRDITLVSSIAKALHVSVLFL